MRLRPYQASTIDEVNQLIHAGRDRVTCVLPCGTGKTMIAVALTRPHHRVAVLVPTVALLAQTLDVFTRHHPTATVVAVCSPTGLAATPVVDDVSPEEITGGVTTDPDRLAMTLRSTAGPVIVVGTYTSAHVIATATQDTGTTWDVLVCDEAHRTAGLADKSWALPLDPNLITARTRMFLTATPRQVSVTDDQVDDTGEPLLVSSMDDPARYGPIHAPLSFRDAINQRWLSDYRVAVVTVTDTEVETALGSHAVTSDGEALDVTTAAGQVALLRYARTHPDVRSVLAFHNTIRASQEWAAQWGTVAELTGYEPTDTTCTHIDGTMPQTDRVTALDTLQDVPTGQVSVVSNCRVLSEGVDVPSLDAVLFAQPRTSGPDIVQIVGRAMRPHPDGTHRKAVIIVPVLIRTRDQHTTTETVVARGAFLPVWQILTTLAHEDTHLFDMLAKARTSTEPGTGEDDPNLGDLTGGIVEVDHSPGLPAQVATGFTLQVLRRTTTPWVVTAARLAGYAAKTGNRSPRRGFQLPDGFPLGERVAQLRAAHQAGRLHPAIITHVERAIPEFQWAAPAVTRKQRRTFDQWCDLLASHVTKTGARRVLPFETTTGPDGGRVPIGAWVHTQFGSRLTEEQRTRLTGIVPDQAAAAP